MFTKSPIVQWTNEKYKKWRGITTMPIVKNELIRLRIVMGLHVYMEYRKLNHCWEIPLSHALHEPNIRSIGGMDGISFFMVTPGTIKFPYPMKSKKRQLSLVHMELFHSNTCLLDCGILSLISKIICCQFYQTWWKIQWRYSWINSQW